MGTGFMYIYNYLSIERLFPTIPVMPPPFQMFPRSNKILRVQAAAQHITFYSMKIIYR